MWLWRDMKQEYARKFSEIWPVQFDLFLVGYFTVSFIVLPRCVLCSQIIWWRWRWWWWWWWWWCWWCCLRSCVKAMSWCLHCLQSSTEQTHFQVLAFCSRSHSSTQQWNSIWISAAWSGHRLDRLFFLLLEKKRMVIISVCSLAVSPFNAGR